MAFNQKFFAPVAPNSTEAPRHWTYRTDDQMFNVLLPDYFSDKRFQLEVGDSIYVVASDRQAVIVYQGEGEESKVLPASDPELLMVAFDDTLQEPLTTNTPIQVTFGPQQTSNDGSVDLLADGTVVLNEGGYYDLIVTLDLGREGSSGGVSYLFARGLLNGQQTGRPLVVLIDNPDIVGSLQFEFQSRFEAEDEVTIELYRDSAGVNEGGLIPETSTIGWGVAPSARFRLFRLHD